MKQKLALMCTLLHHPEILFLDEPTNGVDPVSRRDFWAILYQLVKDGMTVFVTTAYLDEAERCNRVGLMHQGRLIRCDSPEALRHHLKEECYEVEAQDLRAARERLQASEGVVSVQLAGSTLHVFIDPSRTSARRNSEGAYSSPSCLRSKTCSSHWSRRKNRCGQSRLTTWSRGSASSWPWITSRSVSKRARSSDFWAERRGQVHHHPHPVRAADPYLRQSIGGGFDVATEPERFAATSATCRRSSRCTTISRWSENIDFFSGIYGVPRQNRAERKEYVLRMAGLEERAHTMTRFAARRHGSSGWRWAARFCTSRRCCFWTSRLPESTHRPPRFLGTDLPALRGRAAPFSSPRTTWMRPNTATVWR